MSSSNSVVPTLIEGNRFSVITNDDHTGILWVVSILCFIYAVMVFFLRLEARRKNFGFDDSLAIIGTLFATIQFILIFVANNYGLGKSYDLISSDDAETIGKYMHASNILLLLALGFAKCSVISLCRRLFSAHRKNHRIVCDIAMGLCISWSIASILTVAINCSPLQLLGYKVEFCQNLVTRWTAIGIADSITEVAIVVMAFDGLWPLQMSLTRKLQALATFMLRLFIIIFATLHITALRRATSASNTGVAMTIPSVYLQIELLYALLSASIPALNRWLRNFDTSMGSAWLYNSSQTYSMNNSKVGGTGRQDSATIPLENVSKDAEQGKRASRVSLLSKPLPKRTSAGMKSGEFVPPGPKYSVSTEAYAQSHGSENLERPISGSGGSDDMIIRKDVQWHVQYEQDGSIHRGST